MAINSADVSGTLIPAERARTYVNKHGYKNACLRSVLIPQRGASDRRWWARVWGVIVNEQIVATLGERYYKSTYNVGGTKKDWNLILNRLNVPGQRFGMIIEENGETA